MKKLFLAGILAGCMHISNAQECGTVVTQENIEFFEQMDRVNARFAENPLSSSIVVKIPIKFHALNNTLGEGGMTEAEKDNLMNDLNAYFANSNIVLEHVGSVNEIVDDNHYDFQSSNEGAVAVGNDVPKTINIYFFNSIASNGAPLCGYTRFPPSSDRVFVAYDCISGGTTEHELGHYFTLFHTHGTTNTGTTDELVDGSNCDSAGDRICDTPADPNLSGKVNASCVYTGALTDANGDTYSPDPSNLMSYAPDQCQDKFTSGQFTRMRQGFEVGRSYLNFTTDDFSALISANTKEQCIGGEVEFEAIAFGAATYEWTFEGGIPATSESESVTVLYENSGSYNVELKVTDNGGEEIVITNFNFIKIEDPLENTLSDLFVSGIDGGLPSDLNVDNPDEGFTFEYSSVDSDESGTSGSIFVNNHSYFTENLLNIDNLFLRNYAAAGIKKFTISFEYAYTYRISDDEEVAPTYDSLTFQIRPQCASDNIVLWHTGGEDLSTADPSKDAFVPGSTDWRTKQIQLTMDETLDFIGFEFINHSYNGNNLYIDNINITPDFTVDPPIDFRLSKVEGGEATLRWFDGSNNETAYVLERAINDGDFEIIATLEPNVILYRDSDIEVGNNYKYRLFADGVNGNVSAYTEEVTVLSSQILGVDDDLNQAITVYPNPGSDFIQISLNDPNFRNLQFNLTDLSGRVLVDNTVLLKETNTINISQLNNGIYLINIFNESRTTTKRLIKQ